MKHINPIDPAEIILSRYFDILPMGVEVCPGIDPPQAAYEALILHLAGNNDSIRWQIAAACNRYERRYRKEAHAIAASSFDCSPETVAHWCYIERKVPYNARVSGLSIWFHKLVATVPDSYLQREYLETCKAQAWSESAFEQWLKSRNVEVPEHHYQSDKDFERDQEMLRLANEAAELKREKAELEEQVKAHKEKPETSQESDEGQLIDLNELPSYVYKAIDGLKNWIMTDSDDWESVELFADGSVLWKPKSK